MTDETLESKVAALQAQVAAMSVALYSLGSAMMMGGKPGAKGYQDWHRAQTPATPTSAPAPAAASASAAPAVPTPAA
jgi:hypothetical protein